MGSLRLEGALQGAVALVAEVVLAGLAAVYEDAAGHELVADVALDAVHVLSLLVNPGLELVSSAAGRRYPSGGRTGALNVGRFRGYTAGRSSSFMNLW